MTAGQRLQSVRMRTLTVAPIRLALGLAWLAAARVAGTGAGPALLAFAVGTLGFAFAALADPRRRFLAPKADRVAAPAGARFETRAQAALAALFPRPPLGRRRD